MRSGAGRAWRRIGPSGIGLMVLAPSTAFLVYVALQTPSPPASRDVTAGSQPGSTASTSTSGWPLVAFLGDSYAFGIGASTGSKRWSTLVSLDQGWTEKNLSERGTSYATAGDSGGRSFTERIGGVVATGAQIVVVSGGRMDLDVANAELRADVRATFAGLRSSMPITKIIVVSPMWDDDPAPARMRGLTSIVKTEAKRAGATYLDIGEPMLGHTDMVTPEGLYPNDAGHAAIAAAVEKALAQASLAR